MSLPKTKNNSTALSLASVELLDAYTDFILSRQAMNCTEATISYYRQTCGAFVEWLQSQGAASANDTTARHVREYLAQLAGAGKSDRTVFDHAGGIRTMVRFWHAEGYLSAPVVFQMPKFAKKRLPCLTADELKRVVAACDKPRDKALVMLMADSGLRRAEVIALNWGDIDIASGLVRVRRGKGGKARSTVIGASARRALLAYRRTCRDTEPDAPMFITRYKDRFTAKGIREVFNRLSVKTGIHVTPHALRRTFAILSLRAGMDVLHLQALGGWEGLEMVKHYAQMVDDDLLQAHKAHSPVDNLERLRRGG